MYLLSLRSDYELPLVPPQPSHSRWLRPLLSGLQESHESIPREAFTPQSIQSGAQLMKTYCLTCHGVYQRTQEEMLAPPLWGVRAHYLAKQPKPDEFVAAMTDYIRSPQEEKSLLPVEVARYGLKSPIWLNPEELQLISKAIYSGKVERPNWAHSYKKSHKNCDATW